MHAHVIATRLCCSRTPKSHLGSGDGHRERGVFFRQLTCHVQEEYQAPLTDGAGHLLPAGLAGRGPGGVIGSGGVNNEKRLIVLYLGGVEVWAAAHSAGAVPARYLLFYGQRYI